MAYYDPLTDSIEGCKTGSLTWYHEKGHQYWYKKGYEQYLDYYQEMFLYGLLFCIIIDHKALQIFFFIIYVLPLLISESHAWYYAFKNKP